MPPRSYDIIFFDTVGMVYTGQTPRIQGLGGSEFESILLAEALAARGMKVLVLNNSTVAAHYAGVDYANRDQAAAHSQCDVLVLQRYSSIPPISARKIIIAASDVPGAAYDHLRALATSHADVTLVAVSEWQKNLFPMEWSRVVIPNMLPDVVYARGSETRPLEVHPRKFVYASAALKGLTQTLEAWQEVVAADRVGGLQLCVCSPGYDSVDADALSTLGVRFLGSLPFDDVVSEIATSAGLFYVNAYSETFCIVAALAEALRRRVHILCTSDPGALPTTVNSPLVTTDREKFMRDFHLALVAPDDARWHAAANDYQVTTVMEQWMSLLQSAPAQPRAPRLPTICLNMIVKNESEVIARCLNSLKPHIHAWAIVDTGSTDGTQEIIRRMLADLPGELIERPWMDFSTNRNQALELAARYGDYALMIDADDVIEVDPGFAWHALDAVGYSLEIVESGNTRYMRTAMPRTDAGWVWKGVLHEALYSPAPATTPTIAGMRILRIHNDGARSKLPLSEKYARDAEVLRHALHGEPDNARYMFYLAQSLRDAGQLQESLAAYAKRVAMQGWAEEVYFSMFQIAVLRERTGAAYAETVAAYLDAYDFRPSRAEAPCELARFCRLNKRFAAARAFGRIAAALPVPGDLLFIDHTVYGWRARDEVAVAEYWCGNYAESARLCRELLADARLPAGERARVQANLGFSLPHLPAT